MNLQGYAILNKNCNLKWAMGGADLWQGKIVRIMEFGHDESILVIDASATHMAQFEKDDIAKSFRCSECTDVICPPNLTEIEKMVYVAKVFSRKGGYAPILKHLVIGASLHRGEFNDSVLWQKK